MRLGPLDEHGQLAALLANGAVDLGGVVWGGVSGEVSPSHYGVQCRFAWA